MSHRLQRTTCARAGAAPLWAVVHGSTVKQLMEPLRPAPESVFRAYMDLLGQVFLFLRGRAHNPSFDRDELFDLADALHNLPQLLTNYGDWVDDQKFRELYLRPFDECWSKDAFSLEQFLDQQIKVYEKRQS